VIHIQLSQLPVRVQTLRRFSAPDPWHDGRTAEWTLNLYRIVAESMARNGRPATIPVLTDSEKISGDPRQALLRGDEAIGIEVDGWYRLLPRELGRLWARGEVADMLLPHLIKAMEPRLRRRDFLRPMSRNGLSLLAALSGTAAAVCLIAYLAVAPASGHALALVDREMWLSSPLSAQTVSLTGGGLEPKGSLRLASADISPPAGLSMPDGSTMLGWFDASREKRLILFRPDHRPAFNRPEEGPVVPAADLGIPSARLAALQGQLPDLNIEYVLVDEGVWSDQAAAPAVAPLLPWLAGMLSIPAVMCLIGDAIRKMRDRRIESGFRAAMADGRR
jgi:hypothetical protein